MFITAGAWQLVAPRCGGSAEPPAARLRFCSLLGMSELNEGVLVRRPTLSCHRVTSNPAPYPGEASHTRVRRRVINPKPGHMIAAQGFPAVASGARATQRLAPAPFCLLLSRLQTSGENDEGYDIGSPVGKTWARRAQIHFWILVG